MLHWHSGVVHLLLTYTAKKPKMLTTTAFSRVKVKRTVSRTVSRCVTFRHEADACQFSATILFHSIRVFCQLLDASSNPSTSCSTSTVAERV